MNRIEIIENQIDKHFTALKKLDGKTVSLATARDKFMSVELLSSVLKVYPVPSDSQVKFERLYEAWKRITTAAKKEGTVTVAISDGFKGLGIAYEKSRIPGPAKVTPEKIEKLKEEVNKLLTRIDNTPQKLPQYKELQERYKKKAKELKEAETAFNLSEQNRKERAEQIKASEKLIKELPAETRSALDTILNLFLDVKVKNTTVAEARKELKEAKNALDFALENAIAERSFSGTQGLGIAKQIKKIKDEPRRQPEPEPEEPEEPDDADCFAVELPIKSVFTDPERFQNRTSAFSELSADAVAKNFDPNKFDPITVWVDPKDGKTYVLSGHSRLEGMKRRKAKSIPAKYFAGSEAEAIQFARVDANRSATAESITEDLKAYVLMRDGNAKKGIVPASKKELSSSFKGKVNQLENYSRLNPDGRFIEALTLAEENNETEYPNIKRYAGWIGELKKSEPINDSQERQIFEFIYSDKYAQVAYLPKEELFDLIKERISTGREKIFDCNSGSCDEVKDLSDFVKDKEKEALIKELRDIEKNIEYIRKRMNSPKPYDRIYTPEEKKTYRSIADELEKEADRLRKQLGQSKNDAALFGTG